MNKSFYFIFILIIGFVTSTFGQNTLELTFTAQNNGQYVPLDHILIENLTQGGDTTLYAPDTVLILDIVTGIGDYGSNSENSFIVSQNYPNPFSHQTAINIYLPQKEKIEIIVRDILGREVGYYENTLSGGKHIYTLYPGNEKFYLCTVSGEYASKTIKMVNANSTPSNGAQCKIVYTAYDETAINNKSQKASNNFVFDHGDQLRYIGYAKTINEVNGSDVIVDAPETNELYVFEIAEGIPCPGAPTVNYGLQVYNTVQIGTQCWLKENLNIGIMIPGSNDMYDNGILEKYCYNDEEDSCTKYGGHYMWDEIMQYTTVNGAQGICPEGWHIHTDEELKILEGTVDSQYPVGDPAWDDFGFRGLDVGKNLKSITGWEPNLNGVDLYGFTALRSGTGNDGCIWSSSEEGTDVAWWRWFNSYENSLYRGTAVKEMYAFSVRCVKAVFR
jgi:uncharacterized protein (TIGR02145 family)